uniref:Uncharacterized protein n=1 Tax=Rhizophora mucronata TaxID=61149 RepID=A0A2P2PUZ0_RHIMU
MLQLSTRKIVFDFRICRGKRKRKRTKNCNRTC